MKTARPASPLEAHLGYWLRMVSNHVSHAFKTKVEAQGVTVAEWVILRALFDQPPARPSEVAERVGLTRGAVSKLVDRLVAKRLVACEADEHDRRAQRLVLTAAGRRLVPRLAALADQNDAEAFDHLDPAERAALLATLEGLARHHGLRAAPLE